LPHGYDEGAVVFCFVLCTRFFKGQVTFMSEKSAVAKKPSKEVNKSEEIRKVATGMKAKGEKPRPVAIIATLKKQGVVVSSPQVSMVLKRMGFRPRKRRKAGKAAAAGKVAAVKAAPRNGSISVDDLMAAKKVASTFGGADRAIAALSALKQFQGR
jgi:hypothetical protein